ncbi:MAG: transporter substrate-binding protein [Microbacterium sp.]|uniref:peptide ABC transporter substrate-binding protein n=1 Tax=Microbacterium sp. TaxID=51671 RepID=UPI00260CF2D3|nr:ABC transporter substrate-binding protein [Microbacterium sp.]MDF2561727.1 transporter substrate-binding protein [Microbacterium sp.]
MTRTSARPRTRTRWIPTLAIFAAASTALAACSTTSDGAPPTESANVDAILAVGIQKPTSLIPGNSSGLFANTVVGALFDGLVDYDPQTGETRNLVAASIESTDQRVWQIEIEDGWTFHNGEPVDADAFARAWNAAVDPDNAWVQSDQFSNIEGYDAVAPAEGEPTAETLSGVVVTDDLHLTVTLKTANSQFPYLLGRQYYSPLPQAALDDPEGFAVQPIGNGPYAMSEPWTGGDEIVTETYDDYAGTAPANGGVTFRIYTGNDVAYTDYQAGAVDIVTLNSADIPEAEGAYPELVRRSAKDDWRNYLSLPTYLPGFDNPDIRRALSMAIDREAIIASLLDGQAHVATDYDIPVSVGYRDDACGDSCTYDPDAARALWDAAGGIEGPLTVTSVTGTGREIWAEAIANQWAETFETEVTVAQVASENTWSGILGKEVQSPVALGAPANYPSPLDTLGPSYSSAGSVNGSFYNNPEFDALLADAAAAADTEDQMDLYAQAKDLLIRDTASILLWTYPSTYVVSERAASWTPDSFNKGEFGAVTISE